MTRDPQPTMKNDSSFKLVAAIILAGVIVALASPSHSAADPAHPANDLIATVHAAE